MPIASETGIIPAKTACLNFARLKGAFIRIVIMPAIPVQLARNNRSSARFAVLLQVRHRYTWHMSPRLIADYCLARRADDWQVTRPCNIPIGIVMPRVNTLLPFLSAIAGVAIFSVMDALMKRASIAADVYNALLFRSLIGAALMLPLWLLTGGRWPEASTLRLHALRSTVVAGMAGLFFWGLVRIPLAEGIALSFIAPLISLFLAGWLLRERIERRAIMASLLGFAGVIVIGAARMGGARDDAAAWGVAAVLGSAVLYAWNLILQRQQAQRASPQEVAMFQNLCVGGLLVLGAPWLAALPAPPVMLDIAGAAVLAAVALMLLSWAYARAQAQALVATEYTAFIWATIMGWLWFNEGVTWPTIAGVALIVAACWIAARKRTEVTAL
jgi:S-adenosylmethionine uptake transporter